MLALAVAAILPQVAILQHLAINSYCRNIAAVLRQYSYCAKGHDVVWLKSFDKLNPLWLLHVPIIDFVCILGPFFFFTFKVGSSFLLSIFFHE